MRRRTRFTTLSAAKSRLTGKARGNLPPVKPRDKKYLGPLLKTSPRITHFRRSFTGCSRTCTPHVSLTPNSRSQPHTAATSFGVARASAPFVNRCGREVALRKPQRKNKYGYRRVPSPRRYGPAAAATAADADLPLAEPARRRGRGLHSFPFHLNLSSSVHRITQINS